MSNIRNQFVTELSRFYIYITLDEFVKSSEIVMPDLIRHPEHIEFTGFRLSPE